MRCTCQRDTEGPHHHRFGGTFTCRDPRPCPGCGNVKPVEFLAPMRICPNCDGRDIRHAWIAMNEADSDGWSCLDCDHCWAT